LGSFRKNAVYRCQSPRLGSFRKTVRTVRGREIGFVSQKRRVPVSVTQIGFVSQNGLGRSASGIGFVSQERRVPLSVTQIGFVSQNGSDGSRNAKLGSFRKSAGTGSKRRIAQVGFRVAALRISNNS
jgi:hypothetical protein